MDAELTLRLPADLAARLDGWIALQSLPRPTREEAALRLIGEALRQADAAAPGIYRATRIGPEGTIDEWRGGAKNDEDAAHRLGQHLKTRADQSAPGYAPENEVTLIRPSGEIVTVTHMREWIARLSGWGAPADPTNSDSI